MSACLIMRGTKLLLMLVWFLIASDSFIALLLFSFFTFRHLITWDSYENVLYASFSPQVHGMYMFYMPPSFQYS